MFGHWLSNNIFYIVMIAAFLLYSYQIDKLLDKE